MLRLMAQYKRSQNAILLGIIVILAIGMIIAYGTPARSLFASATATGKVVEPPSDTEVVASVDGRVITVKEYADGIERFLAMYKMYGQNSPDSQLPKSVRDLRARGTDKELLRSLIREKVVEIEAERLGLTATDEEVRQRIREQFTQDGKWIGYEKFRRQIERSGQTVIEYEKSLRDSITEEKLKNFITGGIQISAQDIEQDYKNSNTKLDLGFVIINDVDFLKTVTPPTDAEIRAYFDSHKELFRVTGEQRKIRYLYVNQEKAGITIPVSDEDLRKEYNPDNQIKNIRVQEIVLNVLAEKDEPTVKTKALELISRARGNGADKPGEDFAKLAQGNSQDTATATKGGDLGLVERSSVKSGDALEEAFKMKVGEVSEPIRRGNQYFIFKVTERNSKTFEEAKEGLLASVRNRLSYKKASEIADKAEELLVKSRDVNKTAAEVAKMLTTKDSVVNPADVIRETPYFVPGDELPEIGSNPSFEETTGLLTQKGEVGTKVGVRGGFAIPQLAENVRKGGDPIFEEVKDKAAERAKKDKMLQMAYDQAVKLIAEAKTADALKATAEKMSLKYLDTKEATIATSLDGKTYAAAYPSAAKLKVGELVPVPLYSSFDSKFISVAVVGVTSRKDADLTQLASQTKSIEERLRSTRANNLFDAYVDNFKKRMKDAGRLKVEKEVVERLLTSMAANEASGNQ
ncbi:MAG: SurA N-terminal domain-containing protein [Blastocatellia bacterium]|nr:SurA N-terminal domain-containing protein [Blastocatellia bacterium]